MGVKMSRIEIIRKNYIVDPVIPTFDALWLLNRLDKAREALQEIAKGYGRFSTDQFEHCRNTVEDMKELAAKAVEEMEL